MGRFALRGVVQGIVVVFLVTVVVFVMVQRIYVRTLLGKPIKIAGQD